MECAGFRYFYLHNVHTSLPQLKDDSRHDRTIHELVQFARNLVGLIVNN